MQLNGWEMKMFLINATMKINRWLERGFKALGLVKT
jgi:hypothetical protein